MTWWGHVARNGAHTSRLDRRQERPDADNVQHKVRLSGIDAPEIGKGKKDPGQPLGTRSREYIQKLVDGKPVRVEWRERDRYKRILGDVFVADEGGNETWVNLAMIQAGLAWHYVHYDKRKPLVDAEVEARKAKRGLWADKNPRAPWDWRELQRERQGES